VVFGPKHTDAQQQAVTTPLKTFSSKLSIEVFPQLAPGPITPAYIQLDLHISPMFIREPYYCVVDLRRCLDTHLDDARSVRARDSVTHPP
jgi:hypothetical protein